MRILLAAGVIRAGVRYPAPMLPTSKAIDTHLDLISCANRKKPCGNDYTNATLLRYRTRMENAYPTQDEFETRAKALGIIIERDGCIILEHQKRSDARYEERRDSEQELPLGVPRG